MKLVQLEVELN